MRVVRALCGAVAGAACCGTGPTDLRSRGVGGGADAARHAGRSTLARLAERLPAARRPPDGQGVPVAARAHACRADG
eukprot:4182803-Prymnesium_polylepis.1